MKNKYIDKIAAFACTGLLLVSCGNFEDTNVDPNNPSQPNTSMLFTTALRELPFCVFNTSGNALSDAENSLYNPWTQLYPQYFSERQNVQFGRYQIPTSDIGNFYRYHLKGLKQIIDLNSDESTKNETYVLTLGSSENQIAVARTVSDMFYRYFTDMFGMIVYSEALQGDDGNFTPKLDSQKDVYEGLHKDLKEAYDQFDEEGTLNSQYDIVYDGDIAKWKKANASVRMMMAIKLSDVDPEKGKAWFIEAYNDGVIESNEDNLVYKYYANAENENLLYYNNVTEGRRDFCPCKTIVDKMNELSDPRRPFYFTTNTAGEYKGIPIGLAQTDIAKYNKDNSFFNANLYKQNTPVIIISAARMKLIEAEAAVRGWISADAETLYKEGIQLSMEAKANLVGAKVEEISSEIATYLESAGVKFAGTSDDKIKLIALQRWINGYLEDGIEAWSDWRRLNYPVLNVGPAVNEITHIPYRRVYGSDDKSANQASFEAAIAEQGTDNYNTRVWWDVADN